MGTAQLGMFSFLLTMLGLVIIIIIIIIIM